MSKLRPSEQEIEVFKELYNDIPFVRNLVRSYETDERDIEIMENIKTYEDACVELCIEPIDEEKFDELGLGEYEMTFHKLKTIVEALNGKDHLYEYNERMCNWYPRFMVDDITSEFIFISSVNDMDNTTLICFEALALKKKVLADYCGKQFISLWSKLMI